MKANGEIAKEMAEECKFGRMALYMKGIGRII